MRRWIWEPTCTDTEQRQATSSQHYCRLTPRLAASSDVWLRVGVDLGAGGRGFESRHPDAIFECVVSPCEQEATRRQLLLTSAEVAGRLCNAGCPVAPRCKGTRPPSWSNFSSPITAARPRPARHGTASARVCGEFCRRVRPRVERTENRHDVRTRASDNAEPMDRRSSALISVSSSWFDPIRAGGSGEVRRFWTCCGGAGFGARRTSAGA